MSHVCNGFNLRVLVHTIALPYLLWSPANCIRPSINAPMLLCRQLYIFPLFFLPSFDIFSFVMKANCWQPFKFFHFLDFFSITQINESILYFPFSLILCLTGHSSVMDCSKLCEYIFSECLCRIPFCICTTTSLSIPPSLYCFHVLALVLSTATHLDMYISFGINIFVSWV